MNCPRSLSGPEIGGRPPHQRLWDPSAGLGACLQATPHPQGSLAASGRPGVRSEAWTQGGGATNAAGDAHLGTWPSCLGGTATHIVVVGADGGTSVAN